MVSDLLTGRPEASVGNYQPKPHNIAEERSRRPKTRSKRTRVALRHRTTERDKQFRNFSSSLSSRIYSLQSRWPASQTLGPHQPSNSASLRSFLQEVPRPEQDGVHSPAYNADFYRTPSAFTESARAWVWSTGVAVLYVYIYD